MSSARQPLTLTLTPLFKLTSSTTFWAIKRSKRTKIRKVIKFEQSPRKPVGNSWPYSSWAVKHLFRRELVGRTNHIPKQSILVICRVIWTTRMQTSICENNRMASWNSQLYKILPGLRNMRYINKIKWIQCKNDRNWPLCRSQLRIIWGIGWM